ncbi:MAG: hypothetical protein ACJ741_05520 [Pyrinomonadaceae bacterium]
MGRLERESEIMTGRRAGDGRVRLSVFATDLLALTVEGRGERAPTVLLTREQALALRDALGELSQLLTASASGETNAWRGGERRHRAG